MDATERETLQRLKKLVEDFQVCWELHPLEDKPLGEARHKVGYELFLAGRVADPEHPETPLETRVETVLEGLRELVEDLVAHAGDQSEHSISVFDEGLQASPVRQLRGEAGLKLALTHKERLHLPLDATLLEGAKKMEERLKELGASKGAFHPHGGG